MKKFFIALILLACVGYSYSADLIGDWAGGQANTGSRSGSSQYINFYGFPSGDSWLGRSPFPSVVTLKCWNSTNLWASDSLANDSTGVFKIPNWYGNITGKNTTVEWQVADTGVATDPKVSVKLQTRICPNCSWVNAISLSDSDSVETVQRRSFNLADSVGARVPELRVFLDGKIGNSALKATTATVVVKFEKTYP